MSEFNFKSAICTSRSQSERLLALGLKPETADMIWFRRSKNAEWEMSTYTYTIWVNEILPLVSDYVLEDLIPAWSLHRLMSMLTAKRKCLLVRVEADLYDVLIDRIEHEIKEGYFKKEYLV